MKIRHLNNPCNGVQLTTVRTLQGGVTVNQICTLLLADNLQNTLLGGHGKARRTVIYHKHLVLSSVCDIDGYGDEIMFVLSSFSFAYSYT